MPFPNQTFRYTPALRGQITPPDQSQMRFTLNRFNELDLQALEEGWPPGWRMDHDEREANRQLVLSDRLNQELWVFAYGSLIWDPAVQVDEYRYGSLQGWHRSFCMRLDGGRGTHDQPGLMAALDTGGHCDGVAFRIPADIVDEETQFMWRREMFSGSYLPVFLDVDTPQGVIEALVFVMDRSNNRYMPQVPLDVAARMIALAEGGLGTNFSYLDSLIHHLDELGLEDEHIRVLHKQAREIRASEVTLEN
ncbi:gamma-glutamylcyclotransferase [Tropicibacter sp. Alg240-R139]|uniref:gamma-glutamylcyclotransferase n=1 Tax=Tropicibacter sp. Alg240-R139 TaxID=2305991 RepID=UPI0013E093CC|nr:gamma-glutamylcyclotransferase [Tropicibacter sp. Alg240-R139]